MPFTTVHPLSGTATSTLYMLHDLLVNKVVIWTTIKPGTTLFEYQVSLRSDWHTMTCTATYSGARGHVLNIIHTFLWFLDNLFSNEWNELPKMKNEVWIITLIFLVSKDLCLPNAPPNFRKDKTKGSRDTADLNSQEEPKSCMCILSTVMRTGASISFLWCSLERYFRAK